MAELLNTIADVAKDASNAINKIGVDFAPVMRSISSQAAKTTYYFPILISDTVDPKTASLMSSNLEAQYAYFMRACFSMTPAIKVRGDTVNVEDYLKRFHQNSGIAANQFGLIIKENVEDLQEAKLLVNGPLNEATTDKSEVTISRSYYDRQLHTNKRGEDYHTKTKQKDETTTVDEKGRILYKKEIIYDKDGTVVETKTVKNSYDEPEKEKEWEAPPSNFSASMAEKKNGMAPSVLTVNCSFLVDTHEIKIAIPIGIKTVLHPMNGKNLTDRLLGTVRGDSSFTKNFIKWTSGEVKSLTDIVFGTKELKRNVAGDKDVDRWFDIIERRRRINKLSFGIGTKKPFLPNMTIHISMNDVVDIERTTRMNILKDPRIAIRLIKDNFLLAFVVTDDATETAYVMYDGDTRFSTIPYATIKRETDKTSDMFTSLARVMAK